MVHLVCREDAFHLCCMRRAPISSQGAGVDSPEEVTSRQITAARVRFIPEYSRGQHKQVTRRTLISPNIFWKDIDDIGR